MAAFIFFNYLLMLNNFKFFLYSKLKKVGIENGVICITNFLCCQEAGNKDFQMVYKRKRIGFKNRNAYPVNS